MVHLQSRNSQHDMVSHKGINPLESKSGIAKDVGERKKGKRATQTKVNGVTVILSAANLPQQPNISMWVFLFWSALWESTWSAAATAAAVWRT